MLSMATYKGHFKAQRGGVLCRGSEGLRSWVRVRDGDRVVLSRSAAPTPGPAGPEQPGPVLTAGLLIESESLEVGSGICNFDTWLVTVHSQVLEVPVSFFKTTLWLLASLSTEGRMSSQIPCTQVPRTQRSRARSLTQAGQGLACIP